MGVSTSDFCDLVSPYVDGAPSHAIKRAVLDTAIDFCKATSSWQAKLDTITSVSDQDTYPLYIDEGSVERLLEVKVSNAPVDAQIDYVNQEMILFRVVEGGREIKIKAVCVPTRDCSCLPDYLLNDWADAITWGATARLQRQPNKPWTSDDHVRNQDMYDREVVRARQRDMTTGPVPKKMQFRGSWP
jgi:hypothetical protein